MRKGLPYTARRSEGAVDIEKADGIFDRPSLERRVDACCFGMCHGGRAVSGFVGRIWSG